MPGSRLVPAVTHKRIPCIPSAAQEPLTCPATAFPAPRQPVLPRPACSLQGSGHPQTYCVIDLFGGLLPLCWDASSQRPLSVLFTSRGPPSVAPCDS